MNSEVNYQVRFITCTRNSTALPFHTAGGLYSALKIEIKNSLSKMERATRIELATFSLGS